MFEVIKGTGATIPYQLRPHKAIERNLFISLLKKLDRVDDINMEEYRYVGFGAAYLEDFKALHSEFGISRMDCIEMDKFAFSRQKFNNPYHFIHLYKEKSTDYLTGSHFKQDRNQIIWWDFASASMLMESLNDAEYTARKAKHLDVIKLTFNAEVKSFVRSFRGKWPSMVSVDGVTNYNEVLKFMESDSTFKEYLPAIVSTDDIRKNFSSVVRALAIRAVNRGLSNTDLRFYHLCSFDYADGASMTTVTGLVCKRNDFSNVLSQSGLKNWPFYRASVKNKLTPAFPIQVPSMTVAERAVIDRKIHELAPSRIANGLSFKYGQNIKEHRILIKGYSAFYRYLPYYSKVIF